tara:strand:- start:266 stop:556 length:291 start_codon:yes stop_codon:yes gene_type:complete
LLLCGKGELFSTISEEFSTGIPPETYSKKKVCGYWPQCPSLLDRKRSSAEAENISHKSTCKSQAGNESRLRISIYADSANPLTPGQIHGFVVMKCR